MIKAKKKFGQNFLQDENVKNKIIESIPKTSRIVEIGPGLGDLTQKLVSLDARLECFEIDSELYEILLTKFAEFVKSGKLILRNLDALNSWDEISASKYFLVANLPYYVATNMILRALQDDNCEGLVVMIQREVAVKFCANSKQSEFGALAILASLYGDCELLFDVPAGAFLPQPKVTSSVIRLIKTTRAKLEMDEFESFLRAVFSAPRKLLIKNLSSIVKKELLEKIFLSRNIPLNARPHELCAALYVEIFKEVKNERKQ